MLLEFLELGLYKLIQYIPVPKVDLIQMLL
jgi:hypothetical protein